jgi:hypothetical protein
MTKYMHLYWYSSRVQALYPVTHTYQVGLGTYF